MGEEDYKVLRYRCNTFLAHQNRKIKIYFAHSHKWMNSKRKKKIKEILESRGYEVVDPFEHEQKIIDKYGYGYHENRTEDYANDITEKDYELVENAEELFAWFPIGSTTIGTPLEIGWASNMGKKVTVLYVYPHPFLWSKRINLYKLYIGYQNFKDDKPLFARD